MSIEKHTSDDILQHIHRLSENGVPPTQEEFNLDSQSPCVNIVRKYHGSWDNAIEEAGYTPRGRGNDRIPSEEIIDAIRSLAVDGSPPSMREFDEAESTPSSNTAKKHFGSWNKAVKEAGFSPRAEYNTHGWDITGEDIIESVQALSSNGEPPSYEEFDENKNNPPGYQAIKIFGSWEQAVQSAGFD